MRILSSIQEIILKKNINNIVYEDGLLFDKSKSTLSKRIHIDYWNMIPEPPTNDSNTTLSDLSIVIRSANNRTQQDVDLVYLTDKDPLNLFNAILTKNRLDFPTNEFIQLYTFLSEIILDLKYFYNRARPYQLANFFGQEISVIHTKTHRTPSYPSGHTAYACLIAALLSDYYPKYSDQFFSITETCGNARILQGVHYPGDNNASQILVKRIYSSLKSFNNYFQKSKVL